MANAAVEVLGATRVQGGLVVSPAKAAAPSRSARSSDSIHSQEPEVKQLDVVHSRWPARLPPSRTDRPDFGRRLGVDGRAGRRHHASRTSARRRRAASRRRRHHALNTVRKHLSGIKGGRLAAACATTVRDARAVRRRRRRPERHRIGTDRCGPLDLCGCRWRARAFGGMRRISRLPSSLISCAGARGATGDAQARRPAAGARQHDADRRPARRDARRGAEAARAATRPRDRRAGGWRRTRCRPRLAHVRVILARPRRCGRPVCAIVSSGETTVRVAGAGPGGRNQELALAAAGALAASGLTIAAGQRRHRRHRRAHRCSRRDCGPLTLERAARAGLAPAGAVLDDNNSYAFFDALGDLIRTGPTGTNVGDLQIFLLA